MDSIVWIVGLVVFGVVVVVVLRMRRTDSPSTDYSVPPMQAPFDRQYPRAPIPPVPPMAPRPPVYNPPSAPLTYSGQTYYRSGDGYVDHRGHPVRDALILGTLGGIAAGVVTNAILNSGRDSGHSSGPYSNGAYPASPVASEASKGGESSVWGKPTAADTNLSTPTDRDLSGDDSEGATPLRSSPSPWTPPPTQDRDLSDTGGYSPPARNYEPDPAPSRDRDLSDSGGYTAPDRDYSDSGSYGGGGGSDFSDSGSSSDE